MKTKTIPGGSAIVSCRFDPPSPHARTREATGKCVVVERGKVVERFNAMNGVNITGTIDTSRKDFDWAPERTVSCNDKDGIFTCTPPTKR